MKAKKDECLMLGNYEDGTAFESTRRVYSSEGSSPTISTMCGGNHEPKILVQNETICLNSKVDGRQPSLCDRVYSSDGVSFAMTTTTFFQGNVLEDKQEKEDGKMSRYRIRKLTEGECYRLMGFQASDTEACRSIGQSKSQIYHQAGDSIVTTVLMGIFGELMGVDYETAIEDYAEKLHEEVAK
jgi:DNA (cytosine-5)-methyltransferase 1